MQPFFEKNGYQLNAVLQQFRRYSEGGFTNIIFSPSYYDDCQILEVSFGSRINLVEESIMPFSNGINGYREESNTSITNLSQYHGIKNYRYKIFDEASHNEALEELCNFFEQDGFSFLNSLTDIPRLEALFNAKPEEKNPLAFNQQLRCFRGMALAALTQNPDRADLKVRYLRLLQRYRTAEVIIERFERFAQHLSQISYN